MNKEQILELIREMIKEHEGIRDQFHFGAIEALRDLQIEIINR